MVSGERHEAGICWRRNKLVGTFPCIPDSVSAILLTFNSIRGWINTSLAQKCTSRRGEFFQPVIIFSCTSISALRFLYPMQKKEDERWLWLDGWDIPSGLLRRHWNLAGPQLPRMPIFPLETWSFNWNQKAMEGRPSQRDLVFSAAQEWEINNFLLMAFQVASLLLLPEEQDKLWLTH